MENLYIALQSDKEGVLTIDGPLSLLNKFLKTMQQNNDNTSVTKSADPQSEEPASQKAAA